jgi:uncharacterized membrane protein YukC
MFERSVRASEEVVIQNEEISVSTGLLINVSKRKHMKMKRNIRNLEEDLIINRQVFEGVQNFRYSGILIN